MKNLKCLRIHQSSLFKKTKTDLNQWKAKKFKYHGTSLKVVQWSGPNYFHLSPVLEVFENQGIEIENILPGEEFFKFELSYE
jgi:hypothetical protein